MIISVLSLFRGRVLSAAASYGTQPVLEDAPTDAPPTALTDATAFAKPAVKRNAGSRVNPVPVTRFCFRKESFQSSFFSGAWHCIDRLWLRMEKAQMPGTNFSIIFTRLTAPSALQRHFSPMLRYGLASLLGSVFSTSRKPMSLPQSDTV